MGEGRWRWWGRGGSENVLCAHVWPTGAFRIERLNTATSLLHATDCSPWLNTNFQSSCRLSPGCRQCTSPPPGSWPRPRPQHAGRLTQGKPLWPMGCSSPGKSNEASPRADKLAGGIQDGAGAGKRNCVLRFRLKEGGFSLRDTIAPLLPNPLPVGTQRRRLDPFSAHSTHKS